MNSYQRIISLVPSQTELLYDLGLEDEVVGITKFCIHPNKWFQSKDRVGGTKTVDIEKVKQLNPDLIIANKEENQQEQIEELQKYFNVYVSDISTLEESYEMILKVGELTNRNKESKVILSKIKYGFSSLLSKSLQTKRVAYFIWNNPYMSVGSDTFISDMLSICGLENVFHTEKRYPEISIEKLKKVNPEVVLLSSEPYPFNQKHKDILQLELPKAKIILVDGEMFSWYGSRLIQSSEYFKKLLYEIV